MVNPFLLALESVMLVVALSTDAFVASFAYGANHIRIPLPSVTVISIVCSGMLAASLWLGAVVRPFLPESFTRVACFVLLFLLGGVKLCDSMIKSLIRRCNSLHKQFSFSALHVSFILHIYADPEDADSDCSKILSPAEAAPLALALSLDGLAVGFGAALSVVRPVQLILFSILINIMAVMAGAKLGNRLARKSAVNLSWLGGLLLMGLAFLKL